MVELCVLSVLTMHHCVCEDFKCVGRGRVHLGDAQENKLFLSLEMRPIWSYVVIVICLIDFCCRCCFYYLFVLTSLAQHDMLFCSVH